MACLPLLFFCGCDSTLPSVRLKGDVRLPVPNGQGEIPGPERLTRKSNGEKYSLSPRTLIPIAFRHQPDIKASYQRFKSEEGRYDFFVVSRDSLTPRLRSINSGGDVRVDETVSRSREHVVEFSVEKRFFDTTELDAAVGLRTSAIDEAIGYSPFIAASLRYPLWVSRQKLERTSEEIFQRNELNDAQLNYIQGVRERLEDCLSKFYEVRRLQRQVENVAHWREDLEALLRLLDDVSGRDVESDRSRIEAEHARVSALEREHAGRFEIDIERFKASCGLPFHAQVELLDEPFNPFVGATHQDLFRMTIDTDPEIATLRNEVRNAQVELDLARRGRWDVSLLLSGDSDLEGGGEDEGASDWSVSFGIDVSAVDPRVTRSLTNQAEARIARFNQAIIARENRIFVDTLEPIIRIQTLSASREELAENLPRFHQDHQAGREGYLAGSLNIDDLLKRRQNLYDQEQEVSRLTFMVGVNIAELCAATGKFFELLGDASDG